jgi:hypothetical protein
MKPRQAILAGISIIVAGSTYTAWAMLTIQPFFLRDLLFWFRAPLTILVIPAILYLGILGTAIAKRCLGYRGDAALELRTERSFWSVLWRITLCYLVAAFALFLAIIAVIPDLNSHLMDAEAAFVFLLAQFPILPIVYVGQLLRQPYLSSLLEIRVLLVAVVPGVAFCVAFALSWKVISTLRRRNQGTRPRFPRTERTLLEGRAVASRYLSDPVYVVEYAKARNMDLEAVHRLVQTKQLSSYWHKGILFVGQGKVDAPNSALQATRDEAARS